MTSLGGDSNRITRYPGMLALTLLLVGPVARVSLRRRLGNDLTTADDRWHVRTTQLIPFEYPRGKQ